jgi:hypothetical protein
MRFGRRGFEIAAGVILRPHMKTGPWGAQSASRSSARAGPRSQSGRYRITAAGIEASSRTSLSRSRQPRSLMWLLSGQSQRVLLAIGHEAQPAETENHHRPSGRFGNGIRKRNNDRVICCEALAFPIAIRRSETCFSFFDKRGSRRRGIPRSSSPRSRIRGSLKLKPHR